MDEQLRKQKQETVFQQNVTVTQQATKNRFQGMPGDTGAAGSALPEMILKKLNAMPIQVPKQAYQEQSAVDYLRDLEKSLQASGESSAAFAPMIRSLSQSDQQKREDSMLQKKAACAAVKEFRSNQGDDEGDAVPKYKGRGKQKFLDEFNAGAAQFQEMSALAMNMKTDRSFAGNLGENYGLCAQAERMKAMLSQLPGGGIDEGLLTEEQSEILQKNLDSFSEAKEYLDARSALMVNPYYTLLSRKDIAGISDKDLKQREKASSGNLKDYYKAVRSVRDCSFQHS